LVLAPPMLTQQHGHSFVRALPPLHACRLLCHALAPHAPIAGHTTRPSQTHVPLAPSSSVRPSPITTAHASDPTMVVGAHVLWYLRSSSPETRAPTSTCSASGARAPAPTPMAVIGQPGLPLPYVAYVCFKCFRRFRCML
jgi:hypothetical protein